jgi:hypothetical protein
MACMCLHGRRVTSLRRVALLVCEGRVSGLWRVAASRLHGRRRVASRLRCRQPPAREAGSQPPAVGILAAAATFIYLRMFLAAAATFIYLRMFLAAAATFIYLRMFKVRAAISSFFVMCSAELC